MEILNLKKFFIKLLMLIWYLNTNFENFLIKNLKLIPFENMIFLHHI